MVRVKSREGMSVLTVGPAGQIPVLFIYNWLVTRKQVAQAVARALGVGSERDHEEPRRSTRHAAGH